MRRKNISVLAIVMAATLVMSACGSSEVQNSVSTDTVKENMENSSVETGKSDVQNVSPEKEKGNVQDASAEVTLEQDSVVAKAGDLSKHSEAVQIVLADHGITVNGEAAATSDDNAVYVSNDIIYYEDKDTYESGNPYGEGEAADKHSAEEAAAHIVVNITEPGTYQVTGTLSAGQIFVNVGEEETDKVTLILNGVDITCEVAPAVLFYEVYECDADASEETASKDVDTTNAGAKVILADGSTNNISGSYVAKIFKDNDEEKKLHKYDGAFYSKVSMEINGEEKGDGILNIKAENEGLGSEVHLTINGGNINIQSTDDGINTSEDYISVCTINGGNLNVQASLGKEGDGIDSNGWLVINGGTVIAYSNPTSQDAGIDSDMGIHINGGTVIACGNMYDNVEADSIANTMVLQFANGSKGDLVVKNSDDTEVVSFTCAADYSNVVISSDELTEGIYHLYNGEKQLSQSGMMMGMGGGRPQMAGDGKFAEGEMPEGGKFPEGERPELPEGDKVAEGEMPQMPEGGKFPEGERPELPEGGKFAEGERPELPEGEIGQNFAGMTDEKSNDFTVEKGVNFFGRVAE